MSPQAWSEIDRLAVPFSTWAGVECRLGEEERVDFGLGFAPDELAVAADYLQRWEVYAQLSRALPGLGGIASLCLEFDHPFREAPGSFLCLSRPVEPRELGGWCRRWGFEPAGLDQVLELARAVPEVALATVGWFPGRPGNQLWLGVRAPLGRAGVGLEAIGVPQAAARMAHLEELLGGLPDDCLTTFAVGSAHFGVEGFLSSAYLRAQRLEALLGRLVTVGLCTPSKARAVLGVRGLRLGSRTLGLGHLKLVSQAGGGVQAKAYLVLLHRGRAPKAAPRLRRLPTRRR